MMSTSLFTLIELAERDVDEAAARLGRVIQHVEELEKKLNILQIYREEYAAKLQLQLTAGRAMQHIRNYQLFLGKIDDAIQGQQQLIIHAQKEVQIAQQHWQEQERKKMSYSTLKERAEKVQQKKEVRRDQLQNDEYGARALFHKYINP